MNRFKNWLINKFLPVYAKETIAEEYKKAIKELEELQNENKQLNNYIEGVHTALRLSRPTINLTVEGDANVVNNGSRFNDER